MYIHNIIHSVIHRQIIMNLHKEKIVKFLKKEIVVTSSEVARELKISWNTAEKYLLELALEGKVIRKKKEDLGANLWLKK